MNLYTPIHEDQSLAAIHRAMWALGDYALMAEEVMAPLGPILVTATGIRPGMQVLTSLPALATSRFPLPRRAPPLSPPT